MKEAMRSELRIGLLLNGIFLVTNHFFPIPELISGVVVGLGICFILIGILPEKAYTIFKSWKKSVLKKNN